MQQYDFDAFVRDPSCFALGRLPARSDHIAFRDGAELSAGRTSMRLSLDGLWRFHFSPNPALAPDGFWEV